MNRTLYAFTLIFSVLALGLQAPTLFAQADGVAIEPWQLSPMDPLWVDQAEKLRVEGKLLNDKLVAAALSEPANEKVELLAPRTEPQDPKWVAQHARKAVVRIGWYFLCPNCDKWHLNFAGGYAVNHEGAVATCFHCIEPNSRTMREGYLIAIDSEQNVCPVTAVLRADKAMDAAIVRVEGLKSEPLSLNDQISPGDAAYLLSDPLGISGYFSSGMVNRFFWLPGKNAGDPKSLDGARALRVNVSTDWAPGSSGSPVLDQYGNVIGHVAVIHSLSSNNRGPNPGQSSTQEGEPPRSRTTRSSPTVIILHDAVPARGVKLLAETSGIE
jgi:hypothetical protein